MNNRRVVVTGLGVVAPNGTGLGPFTEAIRRGTSGVRFIPLLRELNLGCQVAAVPEIGEDVLAQYFPRNTVRSLRSSAIKYGCLAAIESWHDAGLAIDKEEVDWDTGCVFGSTVCDLNLVRDTMETIHQGEARRLGGRVIEQLMSSSVAAYVGGLLGLGGQVFGNSSACATGTEAVLMAYQKIKSGAAQRMLAGSCEASNQYVWATFDAMRILNRRSNDFPEAASRPMSQTAAGFVPGAGAGALVLEDAEAAERRGARIYAEIRGGAINSGGQRNHGSMTTPGATGVQRCIAQALRDGGVDAAEVDLVSGQLSATFTDKMEVGNWATVLDRRGADFPYINSLKSMVGHCLGGAGSMECVAAILQLHHQFVHPSINCEDVHEEIAAVIDPARIPQSAVDVPLNTVVKANFGFGDVNACIVFSKYQPQ